MLSPKATRKLTYEDYAAIPPDFNRHEIINGVQIVNPAPGTYHQKLSRRIQFQIYSQIELKKLGEVYNAPVDLQLSDHDIVQPDIVVIQSQSEHIITPTKIEGVPDLLIEILSKSTQKIDLGAKKELYAASKIPEYWIVDPFAKIVMQFVLSDVGYSEPAIHKTLIRCGSIADLSVDLEQVW